MCANIPGMSNHISTSNVLECSGLQKTFNGNVAVKDVGFHIDAGETYGLLGPNGAGKTTSISMICGILQRDAGDITVCGEPLDIGSVTAKSSIGFVPQDLALYPDLSARENMTFFARLYGLSKTTLRRRVDEVIELVGLAERADDQAAEYSGGMKRRLNIGIGLLHEPKLLILDEPTVGVDPQSRNAILESIQRLSSEGMAVLYTTHYMEEAQRLCDRIGIIDRGELKAEGSQRELVSLVGERDKIRLESASGLESASTALRGLNGIVEAAVENEGLSLIVDDARSLLPQIIAKVAESGAVITNVAVTEPDLETVFLHLTGRALRD